MDKFMLQALKLMEDSNGSPNEASIEDKAIGTPNMKDEKQEPAQVKEAAEGGMKKADNGGAKEKAGGRAEAAKKEENLFIDSNLYEDAGESSGSSKVKDRGGKKDPKSSVGTPHEGEDEPAAAPKGTVNIYAVPTAPLAQISVTSIRYGLKKMISITIGTTPYEFNHPAPLKLFKIAAGRLIVDQKQASPKFGPIASRAGSIPNTSKKGNEKTEIIQANVEAWTRVSPIKKKKECLCNPMFFKEEANHNLPGYCKNAAIAAAIAQRMWNGDSIENMEFEENLLN